MNDLVSRSAIWELVGEDDVITVRPGDKLAGIISRYAKAIDGAPTVDAIPIEWMEERRDREESGSHIWWMYQAIMNNWREEQELWQRLRQVTTHQNP